MLESISRRRSTRGLIGPLVSDGRAIWPMPWGKTCAAFAAEKVLSSFWAAALLSQTVMIWAIFYSSVIRARRSATRCSTGSEAFQYGASAIGRSTCTRDDWACELDATIPDIAIKPAPAASSAVFIR